MFNASVTRFVDNYIDQNLEFYKFCNDVVIDASRSSSVVVIYSRSANKKIFEISMNELKNLYAPLIDVIGGSSRRRQFVLYHHLVRLGIKLS